MKRETTCCFTGHRAEKLPWKYNENDPRCEALKDRLADVLSAAYAEGIRHFICGMATGSDMYFGEAVAELREQHPDVTLEAAIPYDGQCSRWSEDAKKRYYRLAEQCDTLTVLRQNYTDTCMLDRNRYMVDHASLLIAVYDGRPGGTMKTILYAMRQGLQIIQLYV